MGNFRSRRHMGENAFTVFVSLFVLLHGFSKFRPTVAFQSSPKTFSWKALEYSGYRRAADTQEHCDLVCAEDSTGRIADDTVQECVRQLCASSYQALVQNQPPALPSSCPSSCSQFYAFCSLSSYYAVNCLVDASDDPDERRWASSPTSTSNEHPWTTSFATRARTLPRNGRSRGRRELTKRGYGDMMDVCLEYHCSEKLNGAVENVIRCAIENHCTTL